MSKILKVKCLWSCLNYVIFYHNCEHEHEQECECELNLNLQNLSCLKFSCGHDLSWSRRVKLSRIMNYASSSRVHRLTHAHTRWDQILFVCLCFLVWACWKEKHSEEEKILKGVKEKTKLKEKKERNHKKKQKQKHTKWWKLCLIEDQIFPLVHN